MSSHLSRKELKNDPLVAAEAGMEHYVSSHKSLVTRGIAAVIALAVLGGGYWIYSSRQATARQEALREARRSVTSVVGTPATPPNLSFASEEERDKAIIERFTKLAEQYPGTTEGSIAQMYLGAKYVDKGDAEKAVAAYRAVVDDAPEEFESSAKLALAQVLWGQGKTDEAKKLLQDLIDNPTAFVSADQASLTLARLEIKSNPEDARQRLDKLRESSTTVSTLAVELMRDLPVKPAN